MAESEDGVSLAVTLQNAGRALSTSGESTTPSGGTNRPASTAVAERLSPFVSGVPLSSPQGAVPTATVGIGASPTSMTATAKPYAHRFMQRSLHRTRQSWQHFQ